MPSGDGTTFLTGKRVSLHIMVQPETALKLMTDRQMEDQGLLARILVSCPQSTQGNRVWRERTPENEAPIGKYRARLKTILDTPMVMRENEDNELDPRILPRPGLRRGKRRAGDGNKTGKHP